MQKSDAACDLQRQLANICSEQEVKYQNWTRAHDSGYS